jgi:hypothetical protein
MVRSEVMLEFHQALDQLEDFFLGMTSVRGIVRSFRFAWNHEATSSVGWIAGKARFSSKGFRDSQGVRSQFRHDLALKGEPVLMTTWMTIWSEPEGGRLIFHKWIKGSR